MNTLDLNLTSKSEWIEMFPFGVAMGASKTRPVMIFKDKDGGRVLPVWLTHMDAGIAVSQSSISQPVMSRVTGSPHELSWHVLSILGVKLESCLFKKITGHHQYVELHFKSELNKRLPQKLELLEARADDAISFCLRSGCKFYSTVDFIEKSRVLEGETIHFDAEKVMQENQHRYLN